MSDVDASRKIAVILVADVVGYSKHMEQDEKATLEAYAECEILLMYEIKQKYLLHVKSYYFNIPSSNRAPTALDLACLCRS